MAAAPLRRGTLPVDPPPAAGERFDVLHDGGGAVVEHICSSAAPDGGPYDQDHDEWVLVLAGAAVLDVAGDEVAVGPGDWLLLPAGTVHRVVRTEAGTRWLAVHLPGAAGTVDGP